jgi:hypothetical protein
LKRYVPKEHELGTFEKEAEKIENQDIQIMRDPSEVQKLHLNWLGQQKMKF